MRAFTLHRLPAGPDIDARRLAWLAEHGCDRQVRALLTDLARRAPTADMAQPRWRGRISAKLS